MWHESALSGCVTSASSSHVDKANVNALGCGQITDPSLSASLVPCGILAGITGMTQTSRSTQSLTWGNWGWQECGTAMKGGHCCKGLRSLWAQTLLGHPSRTPTWPLGCWCSLGREEEIRGLCSCYTCSGPLWDSTRRNQERIGKGKLYGYTCCLSMPRPPT